MIASRTAAKAEVLVGCWMIASLAKAAPGGAVEPKVVDGLQPVRLAQGELSGEIGRRLQDLIYKNYMALNLEKDFLDPFRTRAPAKGSRYIGVGKVIDAASRFAAYTGDPAVAEHTARLIEIRLQNQVRVRTSIDTVCRCGGFARSPTPTFANWLPVA